MTACSYTWEYRFKKKQCPEEIWSDSEEYCIFHDPSLDKDTELFEQKLKEKLERKDYNFRGYYFPEWTIFENIEFEEAVDFREATFQNANFSHAIFQDASFNYATFQERADFMNTTFQGANFSYATFKEYANFTGATFQEYTDFREATFQNADFTGATFQKDADFSEATFQEYANLWEATFQRVDFRDLEIIYRNLKQNSQRYGNYSQAGEFYYQEMEMKRKGTRAKGRRLWLEFYRRLAGYGEKPELVIRNSFLVILLGAVLFFFCGVARVSTELPAEENPYIIDYSLESLNFSYTTCKDFGYCLYYSVVTFTTLGYGDIHPRGYSHFVASVEALTGAFFMALFVVVFARKMMR